MPKLIINGQNKALIVNGNGLVLRTPIDINSTRNYAYIDTTGKWISSSDSYSICIPVTVGWKYTISFSNTASGTVGTIFRYGFSNSNKINSQTLSQWVRTSPQSTPSVTITADRPFLIIQMSASYAKRNIDNGYITIIG